MTKAEKYNPSTAEDLESWVTKTIDRFRESLLPTLERLEKGEEEPIVLLTAEESAPIDAVPVSAMQAPKAEVSVSE